MEAAELLLAGRPLRDAWDRLCRYCGLTWSGGAGEVWAYGYFDAVSSDDPSVVSPVDVLAAGALHPGLSRADLTFFTGRAEQVNGWLQNIPQDVALADADDALLAALAALARWSDVPSFALLTKVLHRKRPALIPMVDREVLDWYRPVTRERAAMPAWAPLLRAMRQDLETPNATVINAMATELGQRLGRPITPLRAVDIAIWMGGRA